MNHDKLTEFVRLYETFKPSDSYKERMEQKEITPVLKDIIWETLKNHPFTNQHLTDFIHMFKFNCSNETFDSKLEACVPNKDIREKLSERAYKIGQPGYTNAGKTGISGLNQKQLDIIKKFLLDAFTVKTLTDAITLCEKFEAEKIPQVKKGIYSPWLYYINPQIFPIVNGPHKNFKDWMEIPDDYPTSIKEYQLLKQQVKENDFAGIDNFAYHFTKDGKLNYRRKLFLKERRLFKISHGVFFKKGKFYDTGIIKILEENNWISLSRYTGKGGGSLFENEAKIGDIVYVCYGGDKIICIGEITSEAKVFDNAIAEKLGDKEEEWIYRNIKPIYFPVDADITDLKYNRSQTMPSGNSTFWEIKPSDFEMLNEELFIPKFNVEILKNEEEEIKKDNSITDEKKYYMDKNIILYGPPGTGKTYHSINYAVAIIEGKNVDTIASEKREDVKIRFENYSRDGRAVFTTFHQSMGYEDFMEGIKPQEPNNEGAPIIYTVEDGLFKRLCVDAAFAITKNAREEEASILRKFDYYYEYLVSDLQERLSKEEEVTLTTRTGGKVLVDGISEMGNIIIKHHKDSRSYTVSKKRLNKLDHAFPDLAPISNIDFEFRSVIGGSNSSAYWAVLNAINDIRKQGPLKIDAPLDAFDYDAKKEYINNLKSKIFKENDTHERYVLIIDEINRGNIAQIFGELITLLEDDKRLGKDESLRLKLPYSKESFGVPPNLYIIGTMNTADRSVEALDTALRRRFAFTHIIPEPAKLKPATNGFTTDGIDLNNLLGAINKRLTVLLDKDHKIGHAWLWSVDNLNDLRKVFKIKILPLLQEFFYNDYEKIGLVLGDRFVESEKVSESIFASFKNGTGQSSEYNDSTEFFLKDIDERTIEDFQELYNS